MDYRIEKVGIKEYFTFNWHRGFNRANAWTRAGGVRSEDWSNYGDGWLGKYPDY